MRAPRATRVGELDVVHVDAWLADGGRPFPDDDALFDGWQEIPAGWVVVRAERRGGLALFVDRSYRAARAFARRSAALRWAEERALDPPARVGVAPIRRSDAGTWLGDRRTPEARAFRDRLMSLLLGDLLASRAQTRVVSDAYDEEDGAAPGSWCVVPETHAGVLAHLSERPGIRLRGPQTAADVEAARGAIAAAP